MSAFTILLILSAAIGFVVAAASRRIPSSTGADGESPWWIDATWVGVLIIGGLVYTGWLHNSLNPQWYPVGQDWREFVVFALDIETGGRLHPVPQRYPFYPWLAVQLAHLTGSPLHQALMQVSIVSFGLLPAALYLLGVQLVPRPVAIAGSVLSLHIPTFVAILGPPTDYLLHLVVHVLCMGAGLSAIRHGRCWGRWLGFGISLALLMAATMKSLVFLLLAVPLVVFTLVRTARQSPATAGFGLAAWMLPMALIWGLYGTLDRWVGDAYSLEYNVYRTQVVVARAHGRTAPLPTDLGWHPTDEKQRGYWGVGRASAFTHLPTTLQFLARGPAYNLPADVRLEGATSGLTRAMHLPHGGWLFLGLLGCFAAGSHSGRRDRLAQALGIAWILGITITHFFGLMATHYIDRYALVLLAPLPLLSLAGIHLLIRPLLRPQHRRAHPAWWLLPILSVVAMTAAKTVPGKAALATAPEAQALALNPHPDFWAVRDSVVQGDEVVDLTTNGIVVDLFANTAATIIQIPNGSESVSLAPNPRGRRILIEPGALNMGDANLKWHPSPAQSATADRFQTLRRHVREDLEPREPLRLVLSGLGR